MVLYYSGRFEESNLAIEKAMRLCPYYPAWLLGLLGRSYIFLGQYEEAIVALKKFNGRCLKGECPRDMATNPMALVYAELGREEEARAYIRESLKFNPNLSLEFIKISSPYKNPAHLQRELDAYRKAGMPEESGG
jgi:tetratricopeptide (TPR) repeat protein